MKIHDRLRKLIKEEGVSISEFERIIGVGKNSVSTCLRRHSSISHEVLQGIAKKFPNYSMEWLITGKESKNNEAIRRLKKTLRELEQVINAIK